jgi:reactive chlorine resistance protein C
MALHFQVAEKSTGSYWQLALLRWSMVAIFIWFGIQKFTPYAADAIAPLIQHSPFMSWLGVFGVRGEAKVVGSIELTTAALLIIGSMVPMASALGAALASGTFLLTTSFVVTTPGITLTSPTGFPLISTLLEMFLLKDVALLAACVTLLFGSVSLRAEPAMDVRNAKSV